ncbi:MAG: alpha/beta hydrolase [Brevinematales bacterium]|nr:alpha/beta hydrolase [Brevinematales bacterium]
MVVLAGLLVFGFVFVMINETLWWVRWLARGKGKVFLSPLEFFHPHRSHKAVLLLHEFSGLVCSLEELGRKLYDEGWDVFIPAMPETVAEKSELEKIQAGPLYFLWYEEAEKYIQKLLKEYEEVVVGGASIGGSLALHLASQYKVKAVFAVAAPYGLFGWHYSRPLSRNLMLLFSGWVGLVCPWWEERRRSFPSLEKRYGVEGVIWARAVHSHKIGLRQMRRRLRFVHAPCLLIQANNDRTVNPGSIVRLMKNLKNASREAVILDMSWDRESRRHVLLNHEKVKNEVMERIKEFLRRAGNV